MAEFKKLSAVEIVETANDNAKVLIEQDGAIKRVPKNIIVPVEEYDLDVSVTASYGEDGLMFESNINSGSYDKVKNKILKNEQLNIRVQLNCILDNGCSEMLIESPVVYCTSYMPEDCWGVDSNPELCLLLYHSYFVDCIMETDILPDGYIETHEY